MTLPLVPGGPDAIALGARYRIADALLALISERTRPAQAAEVVERALQAARRAGASEVLRDYAGLPARLRARVGATR